MSLGNKRYRYFLLEEKESGSLTILINNPPLNTLDRALLAELSELLDDILHSRFRKITITSTGKHFSVGANIKEELKRIVSSPNPYLEGRDFSRLGQKVLLKIHCFPKEICGLINGTCLGGGLELALACHKRVAFPQAILGIPETTLGIFPGWGGLQWIYSNLGEFPAEIEKVAKQGLYLTAKEARQLRLVDEVLPDPEPDSETEVKKPDPRPFSEIASLLITWDILLMKDGLRLEERLRAEARLFGLACLLPDAKEGISAFLEKRLPKFIVLS